MGQKSRFLDFFEVVWEFRKNLGNIFSSKRPTFSPLGFREALENVNNASPGSLFEHDHWEYLELKLHRLTLLNLVQRKNW